MHKSSIPIIILLSLVAALSSIAADIKGYISDPEGIPLPGAAVQLISLPDTVRKGYQNAADSGLFHFKDILPGKYILAVSMTSMDPSTKIIELSDTVKTLEVGTIVLNEKSKDLDETVITAIKPAIVEKGDTLEYNADSFITRKNAKVRELLEILPGFQMSRDGKITVNGKSISKILVDGKVFFGGNTEITLDQLQAFILDKVQVIEKKTDMAEMTGINDGEKETIINLTIKPGLNKGYFGDVSAGYGTDQRYAGSIGANRMYGQNHFNLSIGANNTNGNGISRHYGFMSAGGSGINRNNDINLNINVGDYEKTSFGGYASYSDNSSTSISSSSLQYLLPDSTSFQEGWSKRLNDGKRISLSFRFRGKLGKNNTLEFNPSFGYNISETASNDSSILTAGDQAHSRVNRNFNSQKNRSKGIRAQGSLTYSHSFPSKKGRIISAKIFYSLNSNRGKGSSWSDILYYLMKNDDGSDKNDLLYRYNSSRSWSNNIIVSLMWAEPIGKREKGYALNFSYNLQYLWNNSDRMTYNLPSPENPETFSPPFLSDIPQGGVFDEDLSNRFRNSSYNHDVKVSINKSAEKFDINTGIQVSPSSSYSKDLINSDKHIREPWVWNFSPFANINFRFGKHTRLGANYNAMTRHPDVHQLQPVPDVSNPLNIIVGNPDLKSTFSQSLMMSFSNFNPDNFSSINVALSGNFSTNSIVSKTTTDRETGGRTMTYVNVNGAYNLSGNLSWVNSFNQHKWSIHSQLNYQYGSSPAYINENFNRTGNLRLSPSISVGYNSIRFGFQLQPQYTFDCTSNSLANQPNRTTHSFRIDSNMSLRLPFGLDLNTDFSYSDTRGYSSGFDMNEALWNARISYSFPSSRMFTVSVQAVDILGQKKNFNRFVRADMISESRTNDLTRFFLIALSLNLHKFGI